MNFYKHHIGDYDADTAHLSWLEDAAYRRLMCLYYRREQPIPADVAQACRLVRAASKAERDAVATVLREFFVLTDGGWRQDRCDGEIEAFSKKLEANRGNGLYGGRPRKTETQQKPSGFPVGSESEPTNNLLQTPDTRHQTPENFKPAVLRTESSPPENGVADPSEASAEPPDKPPKLVNGSVPSCPIEAVIEAYHEALPMLPRVAVRNTVRDRLVSARWRQVFADGKAHNREEGLLLFREFFAYCRESKFLTGQAKAQAPDRAPFMADLQWLMSPTNFAKTVEGRYHR